MAIRQAKVGMGNDMKEEFAVAPTMNELGGWRLTQRETAEDERSCMKGKFLFAIVALLADELNGIELFQPPFGDTKGRQN